MVSKTPPSNNITVLAKRSCNRHTGLIAPVAVPHSLDSLSLLSVKLSVLLMC